jgi:hypothetical protein
MSNESVALLAGALGAVPGLISLTIQAIGSIRRTQRMKISTMCQEIYTLAFRLPKSVNHIRRRVGSIRKYGFFWCEDLDEIEQLLGQIPKALESREGSYKRGNKTVLLPTDGVSDGLILKYFGQDIQWAITEFWEVNSHNAFE